MDILMTEGNLSRSFVLSPTGNFLLYGGRGDKFVGLPDWKEYGFEALNGDENAEVSGRFWYWSSGNNFSQVALNPEDARLVASATLNGKPWMGLGDMEKRDGAKALIQIPKDFWKMDALAWTPDGKGVYLRLGYRLQRPRARPEDDSPVTENLNVKLRVSERYQPQREPVEWVAAAYPGAVAQFQREFIVYYDLQSKALRRVFTGNDIDYILFSPDRRQLLVTQTKLSFKDGAHQPLTDVYLIELPAVADMPAIDLAQAKEAERNAGWFDHRTRRIEPILRDLRSVDSASVSFYRPVWSPDGSRFAFQGAIERTVTDVWLYELAAKKLTNLTAGDRIAEALAGSAWRVTRETREGNPDFSREGPRWTEDGRALAIPTNRGQIWMIPVDGRSPPTDKTPAQGPGVIRVVESPAHPGMTITKDSRFLVVTNDAQKMADGLAWFDPHQGNLEPVYTGTGLIHEAAALSAGDRLYFNETPPDGTTQFHALPLSGGEPSQLSRFQSELEAYSWPRKLLLPFTIAGGRQGYARLHLPPGAVEDKPCPLIVIPDTWSRVLYTWRYWGRDILQYGSPERWTDRGYAVLVFDIPSNMRGGEFVDPLELGVQAAQAATDAAIATGRVDPARMALYGAAREGYFVQGLIGRLDRYQAAITLGSPGSVSTLALLSDPELVKRQYQMEVDFIDDPQRYQQASPIAHFKRARTPLLIIDGEVGMGDGTHPFADESFSAILPTGTPAVRALYNKPAGEDLQQRIFAWLDEHLNRGPVISGLATLPAPPQ